MLTYERNLLYTMNLLFEGLFLFFILVLLTKEASWAALSLYLLSILAVTALSAAFFTRKPNLLKLSLLCSFALAAVLFWALTSSVIISAIVALLITWRTTVNWEDPFRAEAEIILGMGAVISTFLSLYLLKDEQVVIFGTLFIQFVLMLGIRMFVHYMKNSATLKKSWKDFSAPLAIIGLGAGTLLLLGPIKYLVLRLLDGIFFLFYYVIVVPIWKLFSILEGPIQQILKFFKKDAERKGQSSNAINDQFKQEHFKEWESYDYTILIWSLAALSVTVILIFIWRKKLFITLKPDRMLTGSLVSINGTDFNDSFIKSRRWLQTKDRTRKKFSQFEKVMMKRGYPRMPGESAPLWFDRLKIFGDEAETALHAYEKVRYGDQELSNEDFIEYAKAMKKLEKLEHLHKKKSK